MAWYQYVMCFFGGAFLTNFTPHFVRGVTGAPFPTPFAKPPGRGLSAPTVNVAWALFNLAVSYLLLRGAGFSLASWPMAVTTFAGLAAMAVMLSRVFADVPR